MHTTIIAYTFIMCNNFSVISPSLVCEVSYQLLSGEPLTASRYYKFQVLKPCEVKTKFYNAEVSLFYS